MAGARPHRAEPGAPARPTKGGAVRIRIALTTAIAVIAGMTTGIFTLSISHQPASAQAAAHHPTHAEARRRCPLRQRRTRRWPTRHCPPSPFRRRSPRQPRHRRRVPRRRHRRPRHRQQHRPRPRSPVTDATSVDTADWTCIRVHESGDQYNSPAAPSGAYGILISTWRRSGTRAGRMKPPPACRTVWRWSCTRAIGWKPWSSRFACGL